VKAQRSPDPILVVEDDPDGREMLVQYLQFRGFNVHEAPDGAAALALASTLRPRVILLDLVMRNLDGLETTRRLRANVNTRNAVIVAVTARVFASDRAAAHRAGCDVFIPKPFDLTTLADRIDRLMAKGARSWKSSPFEA
jgi:CheY-like chemotaxis protein